jgi:isopenicillin-N epimerase
MPPFKDLFLLDSSVIFLNHGSFGACPRPVFETYQAWQRELERQPVEFLGRRAPDLLCEAREKLAAYLNVAAEEVVFFPNPTSAINMVARSLDLRPGDEILTTDHEYGAMDRTWRFICRQTGARYVQKPIPLPVTTQADFVERFWAGVNARTRCVFISHITSPTALIFPAAEICRRAREEGITSIVDGAHSPGQIPLDLGEIGADLYTGACQNGYAHPRAPPSSTPAGRSRTASTRSWSAGATKAKIPAPASLSTTTSGRGPATWPPSCPSRRRSSSRNSTIGTPCGRAATPWPAAPAPASWL